MPDDVLTSAQLDTYRELFAARTDVYAVGRPHRDPTKRAEGQLEYFPQEGPYNNGIVTEHIGGSGQARLGPIGAYPLIDGKVRWAALDFDAKGDVEECFSRSIADAEAQAAKFEEVGLHVHLERSRSGRGAHLWLFFDDWVLASDVRELVRPLLLPSSQIDRFYPLQAQTKPGGVGNLLALPYWGGATPRGYSSFLNRDLMTPITLSSFLESVNVNSSAIVQHLLKSRPAAVVGHEAATVVGLRSSMQPRELVNNGRPKQLIKSGGVLKMLSPYGCQFMRHVWQNQAKRDGPNAVPEPQWYAALGQMSCFENGHAAAVAISKTRGHEFDAKHANMLRNPPVGCSYIHEHFEQHACKDCPMTAPYHRGDKKLLELTMGARSPMVKGGFSTDLDRIEARQRGERAAGFPWEFAPLDEVSRLRYNELIVIGANPSMGKTALLVHLAIAQALAGRPAIVFSGETGQVSLRERMIAHLAKVDSYKLRGETMAMTDDELERVRAAIKLLDQLPIYEQYTALSAEAVIAGVEEVLLGHGIGLDADYSVWFDYLQYTARSDEYNSRQEQVADLSSQHKSAAKVLQRPVVVFSQLHRGTSQEEPSMNDFRDSGRIEQDADLAMIITGEYMDGPTAPRSIWGVKQREGRNRFKKDFLLHQAISSWEPIAGYAGGAAAGDILGGGPVGPEQLALSTEAR